MKPLLVIDGEAIEYRTIDRSIDLDPGEPTTDKEGKLWPTWTIKDNSLCIRIQTIEGNLITLTTPLIRTVLPDGQIQYEATTK